MIEHVVSDMTLRHLVNIDTLQNIQDNLANITGIAMVTVDYKGNPITKETKFSSFCTARRENTQCQANCFFSDAYGSLKSAISNGPYIYRCPMGLVDCAVPIVFENNHLGGVLMGQVRCEDDEDKLETIDHLVRNEIDLADYPEMQKKFDETSVIPIDQIERTAQLVQYLVSEMVEKQIAIKLQEELYDEVEILKGKLAVMQAAADEQVGSRRDSSSAHFMMSALELLNTIAMIEEYPQASEAICLYSDMLKESYDAKEGFIEIKAEIKLTKAVVALLQKFLNQEIELVVDCPEFLLTRNIPALLLYPFVENAILHGITPTGSAGKLVVRLAVVGQQIFLEVVDNGVGYAGKFTEKSKNVEPDNQQLTSFDLNFIRNRLTQLYGKNHFTLKVENNPYGSGTLAQVTIPLEGVEA